MTLWHRAFACEWNDINGIAIEPASPTLFSWKNGNQNSATLFTHLPVPQKNSLLGMFAEQTALRAWVFSNDEICLLFHACEVVAFDVAKKCHFKGKNSFISSFALKESGLYRSQQSQKCEFAHTVSLCMRIFLQSILSFSVQCTFGFISCIWHKYVLFLLRTTSQFLDE